jgi:YD repeat-containing protein
LTQVTFKDVNGTVTQQLNYRYDALDRLIERRVLNVAGTQSLPVERYVYEGAQVLFVFDGAGNLTRRLLYGPGPAGGWGHTGFPAEIVYVPDPPRVSSADPPDPVAKFLPRLLANKGQRLVHDTVRKAQSGLTKLVQYRTCRRNHAVLTGSDRQAEAAPMRYSQSLGAFSGRLVVKQCFAAGIRQRPGEHCLFARSSANDCKIAGGWPASTMVSHENWANA